ncbi:MAG TPA: SIMPL domain-containing protein [Thermoanaerobaculia bacterium]|nr:SIMPL domain-containing protein [Thermoanaerobaculia bacterium]
MRDTLRALSLVGLLLLAVPGWAQEAPRERGITVTGHGEVTSTPDLAWVTLAVETEAPDAAAAGARNAERAAAVIAAVEELLAPEDRVVTTGYSLQPRYTQPRPQQRAEAPEIAGYVARNEVRAELHDVDRVGRLIDAALAAGANRVSDLQFVLEQRGPHLARALQQAAAEARAQAEAIAGALGLRLGPVLSATVGGMPRPVPYRQVAMMESAAAPTPIEPGDVTVEVTLQVTWGVE